MSKTSTITLAIAVTGDGLSDNYAPPASTPIVNANAPGAVPSALALSAGSNAVAIPPGTRTIVIFPDTTTIPNTNAKSVGGLAIDPTRPFLWSPPSGTTTVAIVAAAPETVAIAFC